MIVLRQNLIFKDLPTTAWRIEKVAVECLRKMTKNEKSYFDLTYLATNCSLTWFVRLNENFKENRVPMVSLSRYVEQMEKEMEKLEREFNVCITGIDILL